MENAFIFVLISMQTSITESKLLNYFDDISIKEPESQLKCLVVYILFILFIKRVIRVIIYKIALGMLTNKIN